MSNNLIVRGQCFSWGRRTYLMGVLNITPDSFSDGGDFSSVVRALDHARKMELAGVDIIDVGGQSTRPGAEQIPLDTELDSVIPVVEAIRAESSIPISIDTTSAEVAKAAIVAGADIINDISGGSFDSEMLPVIAKCQIPIVIMHIRGNPQTMQQYGNYKNLMAEIRCFLDKRINAATSLGIPRRKVIIDPGIGFAKNYKQNLEILRRLPELRRLNCPILVGVSRKSFIGHILNQPDAKKRVWGTAAACCAAIFNGADILRVHDVQAIRDVNLVADAIFRNRM